MRILHSMRVVEARPPFFEAIDAAFNIAGKPVVFAFGDKIYNPEGAVIRPEIHAHEAVHGARQIELYGGDLERWWKRYIAEPKFRLEEELPAHVAELKALCEQNAPRWPSQRSMRRVYAKAVAEKLAAPLYGSLITVGKAQDLLLAGLKELAYA